MGRVTITWDNGLPIIQDIFKVWEELKLDFTIYYRQKLRWIYPYRG
jgi:hypothetical protein